MKVVKSFQDKAETLFALDLPTYANGGFRVEPGMLNSTVKVSKYEAAHTDI